MAEVTLHNELVIHTNGDLPAVGAKLPEFSVLAADLSEISSADFAGKNLVLEHLPLRRHRCLRKQRPHLQQAGCRPGEHRRACAFSNGPALRESAASAQPRALKTSLTSSAFRSSFG